MSFVVVPLMLLVCFIAVRPAMVSFDGLLDSRTTLRDFVENHYMAALVAYVAVYFLAVSIAIPGGTLLNLVGGFLFGVPIGALCAVCAATAGAAGLFLAARAILNDLESPFLRATAGRIRDGFRRSAWSYMLFLRLTPLCPFWLVNLAAAMAGIPLRTFVWTTAVGILPAVLIFASAGQSFEALALASETSRAACRATGPGVCRADWPMDAILPLPVFALLVGLSLLALAPAGVRVWRERKSSASE